MDLTLYILIALLAYTLRKWWACRGESQGQRRTISDQLHTIKVKDYEIARRDEMIGILEQRRDMARVEDEVLEASVIE
jgi:hypothetical protein